MSLDTTNILQAIKEIKGRSEKRNFVQSIDLIVNLRDIDLKRPENRFQERIELPYTVGRENKICVIATGEMNLKAKKAGADLVIERRELEALAGNKKKQKELIKTYDFFIAEASLMPLIGRILGATLGPRGKMPSPLPPTANVTEQMEKHRKTILIRLRSQPVLQCRVGDEKMSDKEIAENVQEIMRRIEGKLKRGIKNIMSIYIKKTMGSPVKVKM